MFQLLPEALEVALGGGLEVPGELRGAFYVLGRMKRGRDRLDDDVDEQNLRA